jgi:hypothetical protein
LSLYEVKTGFKVLLFTNATCTATQRDVFTLEVPDIGEVERIEVGHDRTSAKNTWHLDHVEVTREDERHDAAEAAAARSGQSGQMTAAPPTLPPRHAGAAAAEAARLKQEEAQGRAVARAARTAFFPAGRWLAAGMGDGLTRVVLARGAPPTQPAAGQTGRPQQAYKVVVHTSDMPGAGTDASVFVVLHGEHGDSLPCPLTAAPGKSSEIFERGSKDQFELRLPGVGRLTAVTVGHDCRGVSPDWHVDTVEVTDVAAASAAAAAAAATGAEGASAASATSYFHVGAWIETGGRGSGERAAARVEASAGGVDPRAARAKYVVAVKTADVRGAGTDSPVFIDIHGVQLGKHVSTGPMPLRNNSRNAFDRGAVDEFSVAGPDMEVITHIGLGHSSSVTGHGWHPASVEVRGSRAAHYTTFTINRDIPVEGKGLALFEFKSDATPAAPMKSLAAGATPGRAAVQTGGGNMGRYRVTVKTSDVRGASTDADAFIVIGGASNVVTGPHPLDRAVKGNHGHLFQRDQKDVFEIDAPLVGDSISLIEISHNSRGRPSGWCVEFVHVEELTTGIRAHFPIGDKWLFPSEKGAGTMVTMKVQKTAAALPLTLEKPIPTTYRVAVHTSEFRAAGTDANVYAVFHGEQGDSARVALDNSPINAAKAAAGDPQYDLFERSSQDVFVVDAPSSIGRLTALTVGHDGGGNQGRAGSLKDTWHLNFLEVIELLPEDAKAATEAFRRGETPWKPAKPASAPLYFDCKQWLGWSAEDKLLERRLPASIANPAQLKAEYVVIVRTHNARGAGTDASVRVALRGPKGNTGDVTLTQTAFNAATEMKLGNQKSTAGSAWFERGAVDAFVMKDVTDVGDAEHLTLSHDGRGYDITWQPHSVQVRRLTRADPKSAAAVLAAAEPPTTFQCPAGRCINTAAERLELLPSPKPVGHADHTYTVRVTTADEQGASTDADVYFILRGMVEQLPKRILYRTASGLEPFQRGATDVFTITGTGVGEMVAVEVGHDNHGHGPSWKMVTMEITDETAGPGSTRYFHCNEWFDTDVGDKLIRRTIPANGSRTPPWETPQGILDKSFSRNAALGNSSPARNQTLDRSPSGGSGAGGGLGALSGQQGSGSSSPRNPLSSSSSPVKTASPRAGSSGGLSSLAAAPAAPAGSLSPMRPQLSKLSPLGGSGGSSGGLGALTAPKDGSMSPRRP